MNQVAHLRKMEVYDLSFRFLATTFVQGNLCEPYFLSSSKVKCEAQGHWRFLPFNLKENIQF